MKNKEIIIQSIINNKIIKIHNKDIQEILTLTL